MLAIRPPAVAGRFYPGDPEILLAEVQGYEWPVQEPLPAIGCISPHAG